MNKQKSKVGAIAYGVALTGFTVWLALDTFVIPHVYEAVPAVTPILATAQAETTPAAAQQTASTRQNTKQRKTQQTAGKQKSKNQVVSEQITVTAGDVIGQYSQNGTQITLSTARVLDSTVYVADVQLSDPAALTTVLAQNAYGRNVTETPSDMAQRTGAVLAVNGDYYGARERGYVIRNGVVYRAVGSSGQQDLVIDANGDFSIILENEISAEALAAQGAMQVLSFGPALVEDGQVSVSGSAEVGQAMTSNPRTALAQVGPLHYLFVVADGRTDESGGLTLNELAQYLQSLGAQTAYNLDGGGSSAMIFQGQLVNSPTTTGRNAKERSVSDIVAIF